MEAKVLPSRTISLWALLPALGLAHRGRRAYWLGMRYVATIILVLACIAAQGCVTDKKLTPPDSVLDPRGQ